VTAVLVVPSTAKPASVIAVKAAGFDPEGAKWVLTTVDANGVESGYDQSTGFPTNTNRAAPDGSFSVGIRVPDALGDAKVRAYQPAGTKVAEATVKIATTVPVSGTALPSSIANATGTVDTQLRDWLMSLPDNATALLNGAHLKLAKSLRLEKIGPLRVEMGGGALELINRTTTPFIDYASGSGQQWRNGTLIGRNPNPGLWEYAYEHNHAFSVGGVAGFESDRMTILNFGGEGYYLVGNTYYDKWTSDVKITNGVIKGTGRMGVAWTDCVERCLVQYNEWSYMGYYLWDIEPNGHIIAGRSGIFHIKILDNRIPKIPYGRNPVISGQATGLAFAITNASNTNGVVVPVEDVEVGRNVISDPDWPDFRWGNWQSPTSAINVHENVAQVRRLTADDRLEALVRANPRRDMTPAWEKVA
jgi:hypothetical protein